MTDQTTDRHTCHDQKTAAGPAWKCPRCSAAPAAPLPPVDQATPLRDRIAAAVHPLLMDTLPEVIAAARAREAADAVLAVLPAPVDQAAPPIWVDGHPQLEAIAAAVWEQCGRSDGLTVDDPRNIAVAALAAVLPATTNHDTDTAPAATCSAQYHGPGEDRARLCIRAAQHQRTAHTDEHGFHWSDTVAMYPVADGTFRIGTDVRAELRRVADETAATGAQAASTAPLAAGLPLVKGRCPACGTAGLFLGNGGYVTCSLIDCPEPDAASTVLEQPTVGARQDKTVAAPCVECDHPQTDHEEGEDPVTPGHCRTCPDDDARHDYRAAAGARQDGAQP